MRLTAIIALGLLLCGCGSLSSVRGDQATRFVVATCSEAGGVYAMIRGEARSCKISIHGAVQGAPTISVGSGLTATFGTTSSEDGADHGNR